MAEFGNVRIAAVARRGDTVLIGMNTVMTEEELAFLQEQFEDFTETTGIHVAVVENVSSMAVLRGEPAAEESRPSVTLEGYEVPGER